MKAVFTLATEDYFPQAKTLAKSFIQHNQDYIFFICFVTKKSRDFEKFIDNVGYIYADSLSDYIFVEENMKNRYSIFEFVCSLKPFFALEILNDFPEISSLKYLDNDILVFDKFEDNTLNESDIYLTPHYYNSINPKEARTSDKNLLAHGIYNAGFFEVKNNENGRKFLWWWKEILKDFCLDKPPYFADQKWLDIVPLFFENVKKIQHLGYNAAPFNLHERIIGIRNSKFFVNEQIPLVFFHFTGYKINSENNFSVNHPEIPKNQNLEILQQLHNFYKQKLIENNYIDIKELCSEKPTKVETKWMKIKMKSKELLYILLKT